MKKKILYIEGNVDGTVGGSYYVLYDIVTHLDQSKYEPVVGFHTDNYLVDDLNKQGIRSLVFSNPSPFSFGSKILDRGLFPVKKLINLFKKFVLPALEYSRFLKDENIDLVNLNNSITRNHTWMLACQFAGVKCMTHEMGINYHFSFLSKYFGKKMKAIVPVSHAVHDYMKKGDAGFSNIQVIHNGIDVNRYKVANSPEKLREEYSIQEGAPIIGVVGNIKQWKGQETLVKATADIKREYPNIKCMLVGAISERDKAYEAHLINLIEKLDIKDNIIFTGFQTNAIDYMNLMDVVIHTSIEPEPFGIVTLEAMLLKKPYISTTIGGPVEVVIQNETGVLVDPGKPELLAKAVIKLLNDPEFAKKLGEASYKRLFDEFTLEINIQKLSAIYDKILYH